MRTRAGDDPHRPKPDALPPEVIAAMPRDVKGLYETSWPNSRVLCKYHAVVTGGRYVGGCLRTDPCVLCAEEARTPTPAEGAAQ